MAIDHNTLLRILLSERAKVIAFIRSMVRSREVAEDVFQDVCVIALEKREHIVDEQHLAAWLRTTSRLHSLNVLRKERRSLGTLDHAVLELLEPHWQKQDERSGSDMEEALQRCMGTLSEKSREILVRRYSDGLSVGEIAGKLGRPVNSLYVTLSRIHANLADCVFRRVTAEGGHV